MKVGTRASMVTGGTIFASAFALTGLGISMHSLPMIYAGNGKVYQTLNNHKLISRNFFPFSVLVGIGYGCTYTPPIQALIEWFPDKRGLASGIVIAGFGSGALFFAPMMNMLSAKYAQMPTYLGKSIETVNEGGKLFAKVSLNFHSVKL